ncbi:MAG: DUF354 domain-containing protein [Actinomycetota bacterium]|nr:DUF354 domain-containing protein [Actinomycetota bacterium]
MRIWIDMTAPAHPVVFRPVIERLRAAGHDVHVTARDYAQTLGLLDRFGIGYQPVGRHGGAARARKLAALLTRSSQMTGIGHRGEFDLALAHGSNELALAAAVLGIPAVNTFDYEWATVQHQIGCRLARRVVVPDAIPPERLRSYGVTDDKLERYPGLKEEYYLADFKPDTTVLAELGVDSGRVLVVLRPPPDVSLYHATNDLFPSVLNMLGTRSDVHAVVIPRTTEQRAAIRALNLPSLIVPEGAVDAQSLIGLADLVVSAGGTMNREAVALGTPVYTLFSGRLGGVDERLIASGQLRPLEDADSIELVKLDAARTVERRDPAIFTRLLTHGLI